jgi:hypothetical protein
MKTNFKVIIFLILTTSALQAQNSGTVIYKYKFNGNELADRPPLVMEFFDKMTMLRNEYNTNPNSEEIQYLDYNKNKSYQTAKLKSGECFTTIDSFINYNTPILTDEYETIYGLICRKATTVIRSNKIEIWYTEDAGVKGTPMINVGPALGLVLKIVRNGNFEIYADSLNFSREERARYITTVPICGEIVDLPTYRQKITEANFTTVKIFNDEKINFGDTIVNPTGDLENITYRYSKGTVIMKKIKLPENMAGHTVFTELTEKSNGDAYDRTGSCFIIPTKESLSFLDALRKDVSVLPKYIGTDKVEYQGIVSSKNYEPPIELMRFITPFGVNHYNSQVTVKGIKWEDSIVYKQDVTDLLGSLVGEVWIGVFIGCYDRGGHKVSLSLKYHPDDINQQNVTQKKFWIQPIVNTLNIMEASGQEYARIFGTDTLAVTVDIPEGLKNLKLRYISTGHGGWENGDEFNKKMNEIFIGNTLLYKFIPWRDDCAMYRKYNPASGNFPNGISSSDYSRSGWCPGSTGIPVDIPLSSIKPGKHTFKIYIPMGKPEGTSFSAWNVSAVLVGEYGK